MLIERADSCLVLIDLQDKLLNLVYDYRRVIENCVWLTKVAQQLEIPILVTEQYPKGLGHTTESISKLLPHSSYFEKVEFPCANNAAIKNKIESMNKKQFILAGVETHVCILQSAIGLKDLGKQVFVARNATSSRNIEDKKAAFSRMSANHIQMVTFEMVAFEWLKQAGTPEFKAISEEFLKA